MGHIPPACEWWSWAETGEASSGEIGVSVTVWAGTLTRVRELDMVESMGRLLERSGTMEIGENVMIYYMWNVPFRFRETM